MECTNIVRVRSERVFSRKVVYNSTMILYLTIHFSFSQIDVAFVSQAFFNTDSLRPPSFRH